TERCGFASTGRMRARARSARQLLKASVRMATLVYVGAAETACNLQVSPPCNPDCGIGGTDGGVNAGGGGAGGADGGVGHGGGGSGNSGGSGGGGQHS